MRNSVAGDKPLWELGLSGAVTAAAGLCDPGSDSERSHTRETLFTKDTAKTFHQGSSLLTAIRLNAGYTQSLIFQNIDFTSEEAYFL